jgi:hypothetical protein
MYYKLIREPKGPSEGHPHDPQNAVRGKLYSTSHYFNKRTGLMAERLRFVCDTLENADYLIPALIYKVQVNLSPKFGTLMPMLLQVPGRTGIRIHGGTKPSHSTGCVLVTRRREYQDLVKTLLAEQDTCAPIYLEICNYKK